MSRRIVVVSAILLAFTIARGAATALEAVEIPVSDLDRSVAFFTSTLDFKETGRREVAGEAWEKTFGVFGVRARIARLTLGQESIELVQFLAPEGRPYPAGARSNDRTFQHIAVIVSDMDRAYARLRDAHVRYASSGPQRLPDWNPNAGGIEAFYFKDPDGHPIEILHFPPGKGVARWQAKDRLFLGIDHTAIVVSDTATSAKFYGGALGMAKVGESENYGVEQEHLNNVFGARLHITAFRAPAGPGVEFLEYLAPAGGRAADADQQANDLGSVTTVFDVADASGEAEALRAAGYAWVSPGVVGMDDPGAGFTKAATLKDPDGHFIRLIEKGATW
jgi:catechol 2,3-dioxygenase-like lactoylglutathione lyase family enzyme